MIVPVWYTSIIINRKDGVEMLGQRIEMKRRELGFTQVELAKKAGITDRALRSYEKENRIPPVDIAGRIAVALGISLDELITPEVAQEHEPVRVVDGKIKAKTYANILDDGLFQDMLDRSEKQSDKLSVIATHFWKLSEAGQDKLLEYALDLTASSRYERA